MKNFKKDIRSLSKLELQNFFLSNQISPYKGTQVYKWLWEKGIHNFDEMTNLSLSHRLLLRKNFQIRYVRINNKQYSDDKTIKYSIALHDNLAIESVLIPTSKRITACISSQVGCSLDCVFCATSILKRMRNLNIDEIFDQVFLMNQESLLNFKRPISNIVFMGMGEPLMNYNNVLKAIQKLTSNDGLRMSPRRITLSTSGIPKIIRKIADEKVKFKLAVSLHSAIQNAREKIMPFANKFKLDELLDSLLYWYTKTKSVVTIEYIIWDGINDKVTDIKALVEFCKKIPSKVNLIQYNPVDNFKISEASQDIINAYIKALTFSNIKVTYRKSRGKDVDAACGQLVNKLISN